MRGSCGAACGSSGAISIAYYDAAPLAAAERLRCPVFYSADLDHGQAYGDVRVINPFVD